MVLSSGFAVHARDRDGPHRRHDPREAAAERHQQRRGLYPGLIAAIWLLAGAAQAETLRLAVYHTELSRKGPGLVLRDIASGTDPQAEAVAAVIAAADADVLLILGLDYDMDLKALGALADRVAAQGVVYAHRFALRPNTGMATGLDLDGNGRLGEARDAQGYGRFAGQGGMAVLSRLPLGAARDVSDLLWRDLPGAILPEGMAAEVLEAQRLASTGFWEVPVQVPGGPLWLLAWHATPPVFDGPEDRNGRRNHDETAFWLRRLEGALGPPIAAPFVLMGDANLDPARGEGRAEALRALLAHPRVQDVVPQGAEGAATVDFGADGGPGTMRVDYVLPSAEVRVTGSGVIWPEPGDPLRAVAEAASRHRLVWVDVEVPGAP
jgi:hypothetical protein